MRGVVKIGVVVMSLLIMVGLLLCSVTHVREAAARTQCVNNLQQISLVLQNYHSSTDHFPGGTVFNPNLPPDRRLGWTVEILPFMEGGVEYLIDKTAAWDTAQNCPPWERRCTSKEERLFDELPIGDLQIFICPANPARNGPELPCPLHYAGIAGMGAMAAELPLSDSRCGCFGYDRIISAKDIKDGLSNTLMLAEVLDGGPFTAGGSATVRGLVADRDYLGRGGQFASLHENSGVLEARAVVTNVGFADGSVRQLTDTVSPAVLEALATIAGRETVDGW
jgi:prepilin-type processing-associated H-X9-DG protein